MVKNVKNKYIHLVRGIESKERGSILVRVEKIL